MKFPIRRVSYSRILVADDLAGFPDHVAFRPFADFRIVHGLTVAITILVSLGMSPQRIDMEERARNTRENGTESVASVRPKPGEFWLLATSASHMPKAVGCFRAAGFDVTPYPVDYRTRGTADLKRPTGSIAVGLAATDLAAHEWLGLLTYRIAGLTAELFPWLH